MYIFFEEPMKFNLSKSDNCERSFATQGETLREGHADLAKPCGVEFAGVKSPLSQSFSIFLTRIVVAVEA
jgi:hypothetical protein